MNDTRRNQDDSFDPQHEQAILASFADPDVAQNAKQDLQNIGISTVQIDRVSTAPGEPTQEYMNPITGNIESLGKLTLGTSFAGRNASVLAATDPAASGMSAGDTVTGQDILLTVVSPKDKVEQAVQIIKSHGGTT